MFVLSVQARQRVVKIHQDYTGLATSLIYHTKRKRDKYHQPETSYVVDTSCAVGLLNICNDIEAARGEDDAVGDPESTVRGERSRSKGVSNGHFPIIRLI